MNLLVTTRPRLGENEKAFSWRLASSNGYVSPSHMLKALGGSSGRADLARLYRNNLCEEDVNSLLERLERCDSRYILKAEFRVCPTCYQADPCLLDEWQYALTPYCNVHGKPLVKVGPLSRLTWSPIDSAIWECQSDVVPSNMVLALQGVIQSALGFVSTSINFYSHLQPLSANQLHKLVLLIGAFHSVGERFQPRKAPFKTDPSLAATILQSSAECLSDWPHGVGILLASAVEEQPSSRSVRRHIGGLYSAVQKSLRDSEFEFFRMAFFEEIAHRWPEVMDSKAAAAKAQPESAQRYVSGTAFAKEVRVSTKTVARWIESKQLAGSIRTSSNGRRQLSVKLGQLAKARSLVRYQSLLDAARTLGLKKETVRGLIDTGYITAYRAYPTAPWQIDNETLVSFSQSLRRGASRKKPPTDAKSLDHIMRFYASAEITQLQIVMAILSKELSYGWKVGVSALCEAIQLERTAVTAWALEDDALSIPAVAKRLRIKQEVAYHLVNEGILHSVDKGRFGRVINKASLERFESLYVWCRDIARDTGSSARKTASVLSDLGVRPVSGPGIDGGRQLLYSRNDLKGHLEFPRFSSAE